MTGIGGIGNQFSLQEMLQTSGLLGIRSQMGQGLSGVSGSASGSGAVSVDFSKPAEMFSKLSQLKEKDPIQFTKVVSDMADKIQKAADEHKSDPGGKMLSDLASKFKDVANGGDLSQLQPPQPPSVSGMGMAGQGQFDPTQWLLDSSSESSGSDSSQKHTSVSALFNPYGGANDQISQWLQSLNSGQSGQDDDMGKLMSSLLDEVDKALK